MALVRLWVLALLTTLSLPSFANGSALNQPQRDLLFQNWDASLGDAPKVLDLVSLQQRFDSWTQDDSLAPFYGEDGCWGRAHRVVEDLGETARRVWVFSSGPDALVLRNQAALPDGVTALSWAYHVAALVPVKVAETDFRWFVVDPAVGYKDGPIELERWLEIFVEDPERTQFLSSPGFVPAGFKQLGAAVPTTSAPDDASGRYQDPFGDWYLRSWFDPLWSTFNPLRLEQARDRESRMPQAYQAESARRRLRNSSLGTQAVAREEAFAATVRLVSKWNAFYWVAFEGRPLWYRLPANSLRPSAGQQLQVRALVDQILAFERAP
jgi:hypothetical protein